MNKALLILIFTLAIAPSFAQVANEASAKNKAFLAAKRMDEALVNKEWYAFVETTHPSVIAQVAEGKAGIVKQTMTTIKQMEASGTKIIAAWPGTPSKIIDTAGEYQLTIPQYMELQLPNGKLKTETTLIGISPNKGEKWYFIDFEASGNDIKKLRTMFPTLSSNIEAKPAKQSEFTPNAELKRQLSE